MIPEYQFYHGALLQEIVVAAGGSIQFSVFDFYGRPDAYIVDGKIGLLLKHSSARLTPWTFTFAKEHVGELHALRHETEICFICLICGEDGFVCIRDSELVGILSPTETDVASVRVERRPREMYRVSSAGQALNGKLANGVQEIVSEITRRRDRTAVA